MTRFNVDRFLAAPAFKVYIIKSRTAPVLSCNFGCLDQFDGGPFLEHLNMDRCS